MAKQFISKTNVNYANWRNYKMMIVTLGYTDYVVQTKDALTLLEILSNAERYEDRYVGKDAKNNNTGEAYHTYHVYENDVVVSAKVLPNEKYRMAKLAGKPERP
jgi:hypothetical protein